MALALGRNLMTYPTDALTDEAPLPYDLSQPIDRFTDLVGWIMRHLHENLTVEMLAPGLHVCGAFSARF